MFVTKMLEKLNNVENLLLSVAVSLVCIAFALSWFAGFFAFMVLLMVCWPSKSSADNDPNVMQSDTEDRND